MTASRLFLCAVLLLLSSCAPPAGSTAGPTAMPTAPLAPPLQTRSEGDVSAPCGPLWSAGQKVTLHGLYRTSGGQPYLDVWHIESEAVPCWARFFLDRDLGLGEVAWEEPAYVQVTGSPELGRWSSPGLWDLQVADWSVLPFDAEAARSACLAGAVARSDDLAALDWAALALPAYVTATAGFSPSLEEWASFNSQIVGADEARPILVVGLKGPLFPQARPLVYRWIALECYYDLEQGRVVELVATIRGEVQE